MRIFAFGFGLFIFGGLLTAQAGEVTYDKYGKPLYRVEREGNHDVVRDPNGKGEGYFVKEGNRTVFRTMNGAMVDYTKRK
jgi:hypothetical protein